jgi:SAM-dependent methyltransferase
MAQQPDTGGSSLLARAWRPASQTDDDIELMVMLLDLQDASPPISRLRAWALDALAVQPGEVAMDVGSGTGTVTRLLGSLVGPDGRAIGVEPNLRLREIAEARATAAAGVSFVDGLAANLPLADGSVDALWCERVLQHLPDPQAAIEEFARVLRPGGRAVLLDSDHASRVMSALDYEVEAKINTAFMGQLPNPRAARLIPQQAMRAGFTVDPDIGSAALLIPPQELLRAPFIRIAADQAVYDGTLSQAAADDAVRAVLAAAEAGHAFSAVTVFGFLLRKSEQPVTAQSQQQSVTQDSG